MARKILAVSYPRFEDTIGEVGDDTYRTLVHAATVKHEINRERHRCEGSLGDGLPCVPSIRRMIDKRSESRMADWDAVY